MAKPLRATSNGDITVTSQAKALALVIAAIQSLQEHKGSSPREIINYVSAVHEINPESVKRRIQAVLKRGVAHGILKEVDGHYSMPMDHGSDCLEVAKQELALMDAGRKRKSKRQGHKSRRRVRIRAHKSKKRTRGKSMKRLAATRKCGKRRATKGRKSSKKGMGISHFSKNFTAEKLSLNPLEFQQRGFESPIEQFMEKPMDNAVQETRSPCRSRRSSCARDVVPTTLPLLSDVY